MVRMTEGQFRLFEQSHRGSPAEARGPRQRKPKEQLPENIVEEQILGFLRSRGWMVTRIHVGTFVPLARIMRFLDSGAVTRDQIMHNIVRIGEKGASDYRAERPAGNGTLHVIYIEVKRSGAKPKPEQALWLEKARATGAMAWWFDRLEPDEFERGPAKESHALLRWYGEWFGEGLK